MGRENENGPRVVKKCHGIKGAEGNGMEEKNKGPENELRRRERKLRGIREQQAARDTNVAWLKKAEVRKTAEDGCRGAEWETRSGKGSEYAGDPRKTRERSRRPRKVQERVGRWRKMRIRSRDKVSRGVAATFLFRGSQGKKK